MKYPALTKVLGGAFKNLMLDENEAQPEAKKPRKTGIADSKGREVEVGVYGQHDDDIQIDEATYTDDGSEVPDAEVEYIYENYGDALYELWQEHQQGRADWEYDRWKDGD